MSCSMLPALLAPAVLALVGLACVPGVVWVTVGEGFFAWLLAEPLRRRKTPPTMPNARISRSTRGDAI